MTVHVLHAGDGYTYLTRQIAAGDHQLARGQELADYYSARGNPPGRWLGSGLGELGVCGRVSESQMRALFGEGAHPDRDEILARREALYLAAGADSVRARDSARRDAQLGRRFPSYSRDQPSWGELLKRAYAAEAGRRGVTLRGWARTSAPRSGTGWLGLGFRRTTDGSPRLIMSDRPAPVPG